MGIQRKAVLGLLRNDARRVLRDRFLLGGLAYVIAVAIALRWLLPWLSAGLEARWGFALAPWYGLILSYMVLVLGPFMVGFVGGFLLLELREERMITALLVAPFPLGVYLLIAGAVLVVVAVGVVLVEAAIIGIGLPAWPALVAIAAVGALLAPMNALFLATFASNKIEAFALAKLTGLAALAPVGAYFVPMPWQPIAGVVPPYWVARAWWIAEAGLPGWLAWLGAGLAVCAIANVLLARRFATILR